jgi:hypothetical protein
MQIFVYNSVAPEVARIQEALNLLMFPPYNTASVPDCKLVVDKIFGRKTEARVKEFQKVRKIKADGIVGPITQWHLFPYLHVRGTATARNGPDYLTRGVSAPRTIAPRMVAPRAPNLLGTPTVGQGSGGSTTDVTVYQYFTKAEVTTGVKAPLIPSAPASERQGRVLMMSMEFALTILRLNHWEFGLNTELSRIAPTRRSDKMEYDAAGFASLRSVPIGGPFNVGGGVEFSPHKLGAGVDLKLCIDPGKDIMNLCLNAKAAFSMINPESKKPELQGSLDPGLFVSIDLLRILDLLVR